MAHGSAGLGEFTPRSVFHDEGRFGRLFPTLPPFAADTPLIRDALLELGAKGGPMDAGDDLSDPIALIVDPALSMGNPNNRAMTAGFTFLGQFLDHDMSFDPTSNLARRQDPESIRYFRIPALDLDSVYGGGPGASPHLYDQAVDGGRTTLLTEESSPRPSGSCAGRFIDWRTFFDLGDGRARNNKLIDTTLSSVLFELMGQPAGEPVSLASRNLIRSLTMKVPSGQRVAQAMALPVLDPGDLADLATLNLRVRTPLWCYVLREAEVAAGGRHLGPVGGRLVAEVIFGLIKEDRNSYLRQDPDWTPTYGSGATFTAADLLRAAGVVATLP